MTEQNYDIIIIGSGAGGSAVAYSLITAGRRVLMLEKGEYLPDDVSTIDVSQVFKQGRLKINGNGRMIS